MHLTKLQVQNLRCLADAEIQPSVGMNYIVGDNGSGKTSLLESVHVLSRARSFRGNNNQRLIREHSEILTVFGRAESQDIKPFNMGVQRQKDHLRFKLSNQQNARILDMLRALPVQVLTPGLHALLEQGPNQRRRFMDWGVFHVEHNFYPVWHRYNRALRQRNASLRKRQTAAQITVWDKDLAESAHSLDQFRRAHIAFLARHLRQGSELLKSAELDYNRGWPKDVELQQLLAANLERDQRLGYTSAGPHRADLRINWNGRKAVDVASRGEQKLLISMLQLEQARIVGEVSGVAPILLIDDMAAELGEAYRAEFLSAVVTSGLQAFMSFLDAGQIPRVDVGDQMFHVKQGVVTQA